MKTCHLIAMIAALSVSATAFAADGEALFKKNNCSMCHKLDNKTVGPALKAISAKYADDKDAVTKLMSKVRTGGVGVWGTTAMPPVAKSVSDEDIKTTVEWILSRK
jgi:cytochrome c